MISKPRKARRHGHARKGQHSREYKAWCEMKKRCYTEGSTNYPYYGGRGITVCEAWRTDFNVFYADMGPKPSPKHTLDRIDVNGNYEPSNCRWATWSEQASNKNPWKGELKRLRHIVSIYESLYGALSAEQTGTL